MMRGYSKNYKSLNRAMQKLGARIPDTMNGFTKLHKASTTKGVLTKKPKN